MHQKAHRAALFKTGGLGHDPRMTPTATDMPASAPDADGWFRALFENSADAMALLDPESGMFVDCIEASARAIHAPDRQALIDCHRRN